MFTFQHRQPYDITVALGYYKFGIAECIEKNHDDTDPNAVLREILNGNVYLFDVLDNTFQVGFVVLSEVTQLYADTKILHVDFAHLEGTADGVMRLYASLPPFAKEKGFDQIAFRSKRKGWTKFCKRTGFDGKTRVYYKELTDGC